MTGKRPPVSPHVCACGDHAWFSVSKGYVCLIDVETAPAFACWPWHALLDHGNVYVARSSVFRHDGHRYSHKFYAHQLVLPTPAHLVPDHRNGNGLDNRKANLRALTKAENSSLQRKRRPTSSEHAGVSARGGKWFAYIHLGGKQIGLGLFPTETEAREARSAAVLRGRSSGSSALSLESWP